MRGLLRGLSNLTMFRLNGLNAEEPGTKRGAASTVVDANILAVHINAVFVEFSDETGANKIARMTPGKMYLNGRRNLQCIFRSSEHLRHFLPAGGCVRVCVAETEKEEELITMIDKKKFPNVVTKDKKHLTKELDPQKKMKLIKYATDKRDILVTHVVVKMWSVAADGAGEAICVASDAVLDHLDQGADDFLEEIQKAILSVQPPELQEYLAECKWFFTHFNGLEPAGPPIFPNAPADETGLQGTVVEMQKPHGGIIDVGGESGNVIFRFRSLTFSHFSGERIYFHRQRVVVDGLRIGLTDVLEDEIKAGDSVTCDVVKNLMYQGGAVQNLMENGETTRVAQWVFKGTTQRADIPKYICLKDMSCEYPTAHSVKIVDLIIDDSDGVCKSAVGMIMNSPTVKSQDKQLGKYIKISRDNCHYAGYSLAKVDLVHITKSNDEVFCKVTPLASPETIGRFECQFEVRVGAWIRMLEVREGLSPKRRDGFKKYLINITP